MPCGYLINNEVCQGENSGSNANYKILFGKPTVPVLQMIDVMAANKFIQYNFLLDYLFTVTNVLCLLKRNVYGVTGTMRDNRLAKDCVLTSKKEPEKQAGGNSSSTI